MQLLETTRNHQSELAKYCRTGQYNPIQGVNERHVGRYRQLVINVVDDTLRSAFPLTCNLLSPDEWTKEVNDFFSSHACQSPQVWSMPKEFWAYVKDQQPAIVKKYPFLDELLWLEWLEVEMFMMEDKTAGHTPAGNLKKDKIVINPEHHLQYFTYPVHLKNAQQITKTDKGHYFLVLHREPVTGKVKFTNLSPFLARMVELLAEKPRTIKELIKKTSREIGIVPDQQLAEDVLHFLENALAGGLIHGFVNK
ncbi:MAG: putative DNA-binding domain-containing protein [Bacteroidales bacterium]|nr:putative DNA-binding domain-containing protein [Bacteroidales bacterium]